MLTGTLAAPGSVFTLPGRFLGFLRSYSFFMSFRLIRFKSHSVNSVCHRIYEGRGQNYSRTARRRGICPPLLLPPEAVEPSEHLVEVKARRVGSQDRGQITHQPR